MSKRDKSDPGRAAARAMKQAHSVEHGKAEAALALDNAPVEVLRALRCLTGQDCPLRVPTGADLAFRQNLARFLTHRVERRILDLTDHVFVYFEVASEGWVCHATRPVVPLDSMRNLALKRLKATIPNFAFAPAIRMRHEKGRPVEIAPFLRIFALMTEDRIAPITQAVRVIRRDIDPRGCEAQGLLSVKPVIAGSLAREFARLLRISAHDLDRNVQDLPSTPRSNMTALIRLTVAATMPVKLIAGGHGTMKTDLKLALNQAKAAAAARCGDIPSAIAPTQVHSALGEMMPMIGGERMRLPFYLT